NHLEDTPTDEPLYSMPNTTSSLIKEKKFDSVRLEKSKQLIIDEAITLAFIMYGIPFCVINNPFFINALKLLNSGYEALLHEVLSEHLLNIEVAKVINKVDKIIENATNLTVGLNEEYLYELGNYLDQSHTAEFLASKIELIVNRIGSNKISAIISDNGANIAA
ncbi:6039_t:CDS:2, partial [Cetraspora pellucida]